jgi:hypothetical protein
VFSLEKRQGEVCKAQCVSILVGGDDGAIAYWDLNMSDKKIIKNYNNSKKHQKTKTCKLTSENFRLSILFQHISSIRKGTLCKK